MIRFKYTPSFADYWLFNRWALMRVFRKILPFAALSLLVYLCAPWWFKKLQFATPVEAYQHTWFLLFLPAFVLVVYLLSYRAARKAWKTSGPLREERECTFDEAGVQIQGGSYEGRSDWQNFTHAWRYKGLVLIESGQRQFHYFAVSCLPSPEAFFELVSRKVPKAKGMTLK